MCRPPQLPRPTTPRWPPTPARSGPCSTTLGASTRGAPATDTRRQRRRSHFGRTLAASLLVDADPADLYPAGLHGFELGSCRLCGGGRDQHHPYVIRVPRVPCPLGLDD